MFMLSLIFVSFQVEANLSNYHVYICIDIGDQIVKSGLGLRGEVDWDHCLLGIKQQSRPHLISLNTKKTMTYVIGISSVAGLMASQSTFPLDPNPPIVYTKCE
jgi:hypothetical protein